MTRQINANRVGRRNGDKNVIIIKGCLIRQNSRNHEYLGIFEFRYSREGKNLWPLSVVK